MGRTLDFAPGAGTAGAEADPTFPLTEDADFDGHKGIDLGAPTAPTDAATKGYADGLITAIKNGVGAGGDTLAELDSRIAVVEALGSLATDAELIAAVTALLGSADTAGDTLGELQALIGLRMLKSANLSDVANTTTARANLGLAVGTDIYSKAAVDALLAAVAKAPVAARVDADENPGSTGAFVDMTTVGPSVTLDVPASGRVLVTMGAYIGCGSVADLFLGVALSGANTVAAAGTTAVGHRCYANNTFYTSQGTFLLTGLTPGSTTFKMQYQKTTGTGSFSQRMLVVTPDPL